MSSILSCRCSGSIIGVLLALGLLLFAPPALAFGTIEGLGQSSEHERITRAALRDAGIGPETMDMLAGKRGTFGAVGAPDRPDRGLLDAKAAHCDGGDFLAVPGYPQSEQEAADRLRGCRAWRNSALAAAIDAAGRIVPDGGREIAGDEIPTHIACVFGGTPGRAKCDVLEQLGLAFHTGQDFYAHSNWTDRPAPGANGPENPPGLGRSGRAPWLDPRDGGKTPFPAGLLTGCYDGFPEKLYCSYGAGISRVRHAVLNKDTGTIDPATGAAQDGTTPRGAENENFAHAVAAAIEQTRDDWAYFEEQVTAAYGSDRAALILCAVKSDDPDDCR